MLDQNGIENSPVTKGHRAGQFPLGLFDRSPFDHAKTTCNPEDVGVHGESGLPVPEHHDGVGGLRADHRNPAQVLL